MDQKLDKIDDKLDTVDLKLDKIDDKLHSIDITLVQQAFELEEHMMRTELNEKRLMEMESVWGDLKKHLLKVEGVLILFKWLAIGVGGLLTVLQVLDYLRI